jgi:hypothetical protein
MMSNFDHRQARFEIAESTVSKYMIRRRGPPSQSWRTFLRNHADAIAAIDLCVVPTLTFRRFGRVINTDEVFGTHTLQAGGEWQASRQMMR